MILENWCVGVALHKIIRRGGGGENNNKKINLGLRKFARCSKNKIFHVLNRCSQIIHLAKQWNLKPKLFSIWTPYKNVSNILYQSIQKEHEVGRQPRATLHKNTIIFREIFKFHRLFQFPLTWRWELSTILSMAW